MITVYHITQQEYTSKLHDAMYLSVFEKLGKIDFRNIAGVYAGYDGPEFIGFISYSKLNDSFINLNFGGIIKEKRGPNTVKLYREVLESMKKCTLLTQIESTNTAMLKISLHLGFEINGFTTIDHIGYVNLIKNSEVR